VTDGSLRSYSKASLDGLSDRRGLIDMGTSDNAGSGILLMCRSGGGCVDGLRCCWGWARYVARCSIYGVRYLTWLIMTGAGLHTQWASALLPWFLVVLPLSCRIQQNANDVGYQGPSSFASYACTLLTLLKIQTS